MTSVQNLDDLEMSETSGPFFQMPYQSTFKSLGQKKNGTSHFIPQVDIEPEKQKKLKFPTRKEKKSQKEKSSSVKVNESNNLQASSLADKKFKPFLKKTAIHFLHNIKLIASAINKLRNRTISRPIKYITNRHFEIMDDKSHFYNISSKKDDFLAMLLATTILLRGYYKFKIWLLKTSLAKILARKASKFKNLMERWIPSIEPDNFFKILWDLLMVIFFLILFLSYPIQISFELKNFWLCSYLSWLKEGYFNIELIFISMYIINILIKLNLAFYDKGLLVKKKTIILKNYIKQDALCDFLGLIPLFLNFYIIYNPLVSSTISEIKGYSQTLIFFKIFELRRITRFLEETLHLSDRNFAIFQLIKMAVILFLFSNIMACIWHIVCYNYNFEENLLKSQNYYDKEWQSRYLRCLFWTVNPGRIDPQNDLENLFGFFALLATSGSMGFMISGIHNLMRVLGKNSEEKREHIRKLNLYMQNKNIEFELKGKVRKYLNYLQEINTADIEIEKELISKLNPALREELLIQANGNILKNLPFFSKNFSEKTLIKLVFALKPNRYYPDERICDEEFLDELQRKLYLINDGEVAITQGSNLHLTTLKSGEMFGLKSLLERANPKETAISIGFSSVYTISEQEFFNILRENKPDYETFCLIKDKYILDKNYDLSYMKCYACNLKSHNIENCPCLLFLPDKNFHILRHLHSDPILERLPFKRKTKHHHNPRNNLDTLKKETIIFHQNMNIVEENSEDMFEIYSEEERESQGSSLSLIIESDTQQEEGKFLKINEFGREDIENCANNGISKTHNSAVNIKEDFRQDDSISRTTEFSQQQSFKGNGKVINMEDLKLRINEGEFFNNNSNLISYISNNPNFICSHVPHLVKGKKEEGWREGAEFNVKKEKKRKETRREEEGGKKSRSISAANGNKKEPSEKSYSIEGLEMMKKMSREIVIDKPATTIIKEDFLFREFERVHSFVKYFPEYNVENVVDFINFVKKKNKAIAKGFLKISSFNNLMQNSPLMQHQMEREKTFKRLETTTRRSSFFFK